MTNKPYNNLTKRYVNELRHSIKGSRTQRVIILLHEILSDRAFTLDNDIIINSYELLKNKKCVPSDIMAIIDDRYWRIMRASL